MSETTSCGGKGNDYINGTKKAYKGWVDVEYAPGQGPDYYEWIANNSNYQGISIPIKSLEELKVMYGDGHKNAVRVLDRGTNTSIPATPERIWGGWMENEEFGLHYADSLLYEGKYHNFRNSNEDYLCWFEITGGPVSLGGAESLDTINTIYALQGEEESYGTSSQDALIGTGISDSINAFGGDDYLDGGLGDDTMRGSQGNDLLHGRDGSDTLYGNQGDDDINGNAGNDIIYGGQGVDKVNGGLNNDQLFGNIGDDYLYGAEGDDIIYGGKDADSIYGNLDNDKLYGNIGNDYLYGGQGDDVIYAGQGDDYVYGNKGNDTLYGNKGADTFVCTKGFDVIKDFWGLDGDKISVASVDDAVISERDGSTLITSGEGQLLLEGFARQFFDESQYLI